MATKTALVTGATSGLGYETAIHLANEGYGTVIVTGRTADKAADAAARLTDQTSRHVFRPLALDLNDASKVHEAVAALNSFEVQLDAVVLNAGMVAGSKLQRTDEGVEIMMSSSLIGHHRLAMGLLRAGLLAPTASLVISGSEAARGDVPTFTPLDLPKLATKSYAGDLEAAAVGAIRHERAIKYKPANGYATAKLFVAWWASSLAERLPDGMTVFAVSPGAAPDTNADRNAPFFMRRIMIPMFKRAPKSLGMAAPVPVAARRYVDALSFDESLSGYFFASAPKKMTGPLHRVDLPHVNDVASRDAAWSATVEITGVDVPVPTPGG